MKCARIAILLLSVCSPLLAVEKWALLVGINDYLVLPSYSGPVVGLDLRGSLNDVEMTKQVLVDKFGFPEEHIKTLINAKATASNIREAFGDWLIPNAHPDDIVYVHFSGHGSQGNDFNGDEDDRKDEIFCPYDWDGRHTTAVEISDDELGAMLDRIPSKNVTVVLDACHSGTGTREIGELQPRYVVSAQEADSARAMVMVPTQKPNFTTHKLSGSGGIVVDQSASRVTISACKPEELAQEGPCGDGDARCGTLTYNLVKAMKRAAPGTTYRALMEEVALDVAAKNKTQAPQIEGNVDRPLFGISSSGVVVPSFVAINAVQGNQVTLNAGSTQDVTKGSIYAVFPEGETAFQGAGLGRIKITQTEPTSATAQLLDDVVVEKGFRAREFLHNTKLDALTVFLDCQDASLKKKVGEALSSIDSVKVVEEERYFDLHLKLQTTVGGIQAIPLIGDTRGAPISGKDATALAQALHPLLGNYSAIKALSSVDNPSPPFKIEVWANQRSATEASGGGPEHALSEKLVHAKIGDTLRVSFRADRDCYLTLINVGTNGVITPLFPNKYHPDNFVQGNMVYQTETKEMNFVVRVQPPAGRELIKAVATTTPKDLVGATIASGSGLARQMTRNLGIGEWTPSTEAMTDGGILLPTDTWATDYLLLETTP